MTMLIEGSACFGSFGNGGDLTAAFESTTSIFEPRQTDLSALSTFFSPRSLRQCDRFSRMALLGASLALRNAGLTPQDLNQCGIVLTSGYGATTPTFDFLDSVLDFGQGMASPLAFSLSVHNIPAAIVAKNMQMVGPCATVCQFDSAVASGLLLAQGWLAEGRVERVLFGAVDENTPVLESITGQLRAERHKQDRFACRRALPLSEGVAFFVLSTADAPGLGRIESVLLESEPQYPRRTCQKTPAASVPCCTSSDSFNTSDTCGAPGSSNTSGTCGAPGFSNTSDTGGGTPDSSPSGTGAPRADVVRFVSGALAPSCGEDKVHDGNRAFGNLPIGLALNCAAALTMLEHGEHALCLNYGSGIRSSILLGKD